MLIVNNFWTGYDPCMKPSLLNSSPSKTPVCKMWAWSEVVTLLQNPRYMGPTQSYHLIIRISRKLLIQSSWKWHNQFPRARIHVFRHLICRFLATFFRDISRPLAPLSHGFHESAHRQSCSTRWVLSNGIGFIGGSFGPQSHRPWAFPFPFIINNLSFFLFYL